MALDMMLGRGALSIVNISSSIWGQVAGTKQIAYHASKGAVINMTRNVAVTYAKERVRANVILPGLIDTDMQCASRKPGDERSDAGAYA